MAQAGRRTARGGRLREWARARRRAWWRRRRESFAPPPFPQPSPELTSLGEPKDAQRKEWVQRYFRPSPPPTQLTRGYRYVQAAAVTLVVAVCLLILGSPGWAGAGAAIMVVLLAVGATAVRTYHHTYRRANHKPAARLLDRTLNQDLTAACTETLEAFGLRRGDLLLHADPPRPEERGAGRVVHAHGGLPLVFAGPAEGARHRPDYEDRIRRFTVYSVAVVCLATDRLAVRTFDLDLATGGRKNVDTHEYHYDHVAAVNTRRRPAKDLLAGDIPGFPVMKAALTAHQMEITSTGGTHILISTEFTQKHPPELTVTTSIDNALPALRRMLQRPGVPRVPGPREPVDPPVTTP
jgi:hypothetical protein